MAELQSAMSVTGIIQSARNLLETPAYYSEIKHLKAVGHRLVSLWALPFTLFQSAHHKSYWYRSSSTLWKTTISQVIQNIVTTCPWKTSVPHETHPEINSQEGEKWLRDLACYLVSFPCIPLPSDLALIPFLVYLMADRKLCHCPSYAYANSGETELAVFPSATELFCFLP